MLKLTFSIGCLIMNCLWILPHLTINGQRRMRVIQALPFPVPVDKNFIIEIVPLTNNTKLERNIYDTMVILVEGPEKTDKATFDHSFKDMIDEVYRGDFIRIQTWQKHSNQTITATVAFTRAALNKSLIIYEFSPNGTEDRRSILNNLKAQQPIYNSTISLLIPPKLELSIRTEGGPNGELTLGEYGVATCRSYDGIPMNRPSWVNLKDFFLINKTYDAERNEIQIKISVTVKDHQKELRCRAGPTEEAVKIKIFHHPSRIILEPEISSHIENGSGILCVTEGGYPTPVVSWTLVQGPPNPNKYFYLSEKRNKLFLKPDTPIGSKWVFNCSAENILPNSQQILNRTVAFTVGTPQKGLSNGAMVGVVVGVVVTIVLLASISVIVRMRGSSKNDCCAIRKQKAQPEDSLYYGEIFFVKPSEPKSPIC